MAFQSSDGKGFNSKFRASRYNRENSNPGPGVRSQANEQSGKGEAGSGDSAPDPDQRLHNNPHSEKFNTPLNGPKAEADPQEMGEEQSDAHDDHSVTCPHCGGEVSVTGGANHSDEPAGMSETEHDVQDDKVAKGVWKPGQREHPDADGDFDFEPDIQ